ncbi:MAG TPA: PA0069 family radical SAM protein [Gammaproteobacteria bacterium]|nr:PA0069 family radical SAM protein [Gammaproteobacteria bacterium]
MSEPRKIRPGRGATLNLPGRFAGTDVERDLEAVPDSVATEVRPERARSIIAINRSPDIPFEQSINPYRGCEHGCIYCYARPSHAYVDLSPGLDFESILFYKQDAARLLRETLAKKGYRCSPINIGSNTDPYQPIEKKYRVTRECLEVLAETHHPVTLITKGSLILRDLDILAAMARERLVSVSVSLTTLDANLKRTLEPRAASPQARLNVIRELTAAGVPVTVLVAPVIPAVNDSELERILEAVANAGARWAAYIFLRLPHEVAPLFKDWLEAHMPMRAAHVMSLVRQSRDGREYSSNFGERMRGKGEYAEMLRKRFRIACRRHGLNEEPWPTLDETRFRPPNLSGQADLF